jgi:hypothetical protein
MQFSPFSRHLIPLRSKYPPQHLVFKYPQYVPPLKSETKFEFKLLNNLFIGSSTSSRPVVMITLSPLVVCTGGCFGGVLAPVCGMRPVRGAVSSLWRGDGKRRAAILPAAGPRTLCHQPGTVLAPQQTVPTVARLYRLPAPPAFWKATTVPSARSPPQCRRSCPFVNQRGCPRTVPSAIRELEETTTPAVPHFTLPTVVIQCSYGCS